MPHFHNAFHHRRNSFSHSRHPLHWIGVGVIAAALLKGNGSRFVWFGIGAIVASLVGKAKKLKKEGKAGYRWELRLVGPDEEPSVDTRDHYRHRRGPVELPTAPARNPDIVQTPSPQNPSDAENGVHPEVCFGSADHLSSTNSMCVPRQCHSILLNHLSKNALMP